VTIALLIVAFTLVVLVILVLVARYSPTSSLELAGLDPRTRAAQRIAADADEWQALLEIENRRRRAVGLDEITEDDLRYGNRP
jgi:hypothetical protein